MKTVPLSIKTMGHVPDEHDMLVLVGQIAGECYNSDMSDDKCIIRALNCIQRGHHSPWEHVTLTLNCTVDRGVSHALVRHRHCAFQQSSTIYQKFDELTFIEGNQLPQKLGQEIENAYKEKINMSIKPSEARDILPNCLATNLIITTNIRQWMYMIQRRCGPGDSDNMHEWAKFVRELFAQKYPRILKTFDKWYEGHPL
jgi:thymidylate synthase (FAD)